MISLFTKNGPSICFLKGAPTTASRRRQAWAESDDDEPVYRQEDSSPLGEDIAQQQGTGIVRDDENEPNVEADDDVD